MDGIREVTEEFYGSSSFKKPFSSLEKLELEDMREWKQWHVLGNGEFPTLENLSIKNCPELSLETPIQLSSLKRFKVVGCPKIGVLSDEAQLFTCQLEGMKQIVKLSIHTCNSLTLLPFSILPSTLKRISISDCRKLKLEGPVNNCNMFVEELTISECDCIYDISPETLPRARELKLESCHNLTRFLIPSVTESLSILECKSVEIFSAACGGAQLTYLHIRDCLKLKWLPEHMQELLPSLKELHLFDRPEIESFPEGGLPFNLQELRIDNCTKLVNGRKEWRLPCLRELCIYHDGSDEDIEHWELPSSIQRFKVYNLKTLSSHLLKSLTSLERLHIDGNLPEIQSLLEEGQLPSSLSELIIWNCPNLQSLPVKGMPSSLSELNIINYPNLQSFPVKGMASSLSKLYIHDCPLLTPQVEFDKGEYWPNIAQIPNIKIQWECL